MPTIATVRDIAITIASAAITAGGIAIIRSERPTYTEARNERGETHYEQMQRERAEHHSAAMAEQARAAEREEERHQAGMERMRNGKSYY